MQLYRTEDLVKASGTVSGLALGEAYGKDLFGTSSDGTGNGWKGGAISVARGLMIPGNGKAMGANFTSLEFPNCCWNPDVNAFAVTGLGTEGRDGLDFNPSGTRLFANQYAAGANSQIEVYSFVSKSEFALEGSYETPAVRVRNLSCYSIQGKDLVYFGEGAVATGSKSVYVFDPETHETTTLVSNSADITADVMNVKVSGTKTVEPLLQVALDNGTILIYTLAPDGRSLASASPTVVSPETTARLCGVEGTSVSQFRNFEVTDDGETAFLMPVGTAYPATDIPGLRVISSPSVNSDDFSITATGEGVSVRHLETRTIITLTAAATVTVTGSGEADVLLVGGGGGGGEQAWVDEKDHSKGTYGGYCGGGGAGGVVYKRRFALTADSYDVVVGAGGAVAQDGGDTTGFGLTAFGGGHGGQAQGWANATDGGCGGGAASPPSWIRNPGASKYDGSDPDCHGTSGGSSSGTSNAGGGGGAGQPGYAGDDETYPGRGGDGFQCAITGEFAYYGGGGGGGGNGKSGAAGLGGGGANGWDATPGTGGGGGGHALGGSGVIVISYVRPKTRPSADFDVMGGDEIIKLKDAQVLVFRQSGKLSVTGSGEADVLLVGGGGGGGDQAWKDESDHSKGTYGGYSGGGGGGGVVYKRRMVLSAGQYDIVVGAGGAVAANGEDTTGFGLTAFGGGHGGQAQGWANATDGGCGGGAVSPSWIRGPGASKYDGSDPDCHGTVGGGSTGTSNAGGGGGAGEAGFAGNDTTNPGKGGDGFRCLISGEDVCYGGGGGGGGNGQSGLGGKGGGGAHGWDATPGTGGGGGGHALGGSGIVIVRFAKKTYPDVSTDRATGGRRHFRDGYCIHTFSAGGTFTVAHDILADVLLVGGGGGGGYNEGTSTPGGGGGAGGFVYRRNIVISAGSHPIVVGQGGATAVDGDTAAAAGGNTEAFDLVAFGGGAGANCLTWKPAGNGASGGGGTHNWKQYDWQLDFRTLAGFGRVLDAMPDNCGHSGAGSYTAVAAGGGGGAGGPGCVGAYPTDDGHDGVSGCGGVGLPCSITGEEVWYAGGGAGGRGANGISGVKGGQGGGGDPNQPGTDGLGGGGGGGARGGSGVVIIRYAAEPAGGILIFR